MPAHWNESLTEAVLHIATALSTERDLSRLLEKIVHSARRLTHAEAGSMYLLDHTKRYLHVTVSQNAVMATVPRPDEPIPLLVNGKQNLTHICAYCAFVGKLLHIADVYRYSGFDFRDVYATDKLAAYRTTSMLVLPLRNHQHNTIGVLQLTNMHQPGQHRSGPLATDLEDIVTTFAVQAAMAIDHAQLITENRRLVQILDRTNRELEQENRALRRQMDDRAPFTKIIAVSPPMQQVISLMQKVCGADATVLLQGETGTGKELLATAIHHSSPRRRGAFVGQNCAAMPEHLLESEFFGYRRGAFTGAMSDKKGLLEVAHGGTLFLDEIGDMPPGMQAKLLRVLQEGEIRPLGALQNIPVNVRIIAATHRDLPAMVAAGTFREDLYYRLNVFPIEIPPLRERRDDVPALLSHMLSLGTAQYKKTVKGFTPHALDALLRYDYPGNIRELKNIVERAVLLCEPAGHIALDHLPSQIVGKGDNQWPPAGTSEEPGSLAELVRRFESTLIEHKLRECGWNQTKTAKALQVPRRTLVEKMQRYAIRRPLL